MKYFPKKSSRNFSVRAKGLYRTFMFSSVYRTKITSLFTKSIMRHATKVRPRQLLHYMTSSKDYWNGKNTIQDALLNILKQLGNFRPGCSSQGNVLPSIPLFLPSLSPATAKGGGGRETMTVCLNGAEYTEFRCKPESVAFLPFFNCDQFAGLPWLKNDSPKLLRLIDRVTPLKLPHAPTYFKKQDKKQGVPILCFLIREENSTL